MQLSWEHLIGGEKKQEVFSVSVLNKQEWKLHTIPIFSQVLCPPVTNTWLPSYPTDNHNSVDLNSKLLKIIWKYLTQKEHNSNA
jgi:hypothetical protein